MSTESVAFVELVRRASAERRPYTAPRLTVHGPVGQLTRVTNG